MRPNLGRCIVHQHVERAFELRKRRRDDPLDVARFAHVGLDANDVDLRRDFANFIANDVKFVSVACHER